MFVLLTADQVASLLPMGELIETMADALTRFSSREIVQPVRTVLSIGTRDFFGVMPALIPEPAAFGAKLVTVFNGNAAAGLPTHLAVICLFDPRTGALLAVMDGRHITEARTAAVSAVSARALARRDTDVLAIIGSGAQARSHLEALAHAFAFSEIRVYSPTAAHRSAFIAAAASTTKAKLVDRPSAESAVRGAGLIVLATSSPAPVVRSEWIGSGAHVVSVGACRPNQREMDPALVRRGRLFVDSRAAALVESGDVVMGIAEHHFPATHIAGEIGELLAGTIAGRQAADDVTIFKSLGLAAEDIAAADLVYQRALERGVGLELSL
jgi:ornithine cyclodeaminase